MMSARIAVCVLTVAVLGSPVWGQQPNQHDELKMAVQKICPVSGNELGAHGKPIKVKLGQEELFVCCQGCVGKQVNPKHWATIHANFAQAQQICPIMKKPLPQSPKWTFVNGQIIYVCCPPCAKKLEKDPRASIASVDALYRSFLTRRR